VGEAPNREQKARAPVGIWGPLPENFEKLDAISCNLAYTRPIIQNWTFAEQKTVAARISIHTHTRMHPSHFQKLFGFGPL